VNGERMHKYVSKEEEFLEEFGYHVVVGSVLELLGEDTWIPNFTANDDNREWNQEAIEQGLFPDRLFFDGAIIYHQGTHFSSLQIVLKSCSRVVNVRVKKVADHQLVSEKLVDKPLRRSLAGAMS
jgi:hypothetical protein